MNKSQHEHLNLIAQLRYEITEDVAYIRKLDKVGPRFNYNPSESELNVKLLSLRELFSQDVGLRDFANNLDFDDRYDTKTADDRFILGSLLVLAAQSHVADLLDDPIMVPDQYMGYISDIEAEDIYKGHDFYYEFNQILDACFNNAISYLFGRIDIERTPDGIIANIDDVEYIELLQYVENILYSILTVLRDEVGDLIDLFRIYNEYNCVFTCKWEVDHLTIQLYSTPIAIMPDFLIQRLRYD